MNFSDFKWLNESNARINGNDVTIFAPGGTDFFNSPVLENGNAEIPQGNAPVFYKEITGDKTATIS